MNKEEILLAETKPATPPIEVDNIPADLIKMKIWVAWNWKQVKGRWTKPPERGFKSNDPKTWKTFHHVYSLYEDGKVDGIGIVLDGDLLGVDLDDCCSNGKLSPIAKDIVGILDCYYEVSPSGTGIKLLCRAVKPNGPTKNKTHTVEMYDQDRYFTITGNEGIGEIEPRQQEVDQVYAKYFDLPDSPVFHAMLRIKAKPTEQDGSNRMFALCCRAVEHDLTDEEAISFIRIYMVHRPFPTDWTDTDIIKRIRDAENKVERGSAKPVIQIESWRFPQAIEETEVTLASGGIYQKGRRLARIRASQVSLVPLDCMLEEMTLRASFERLNCKGELVSCLPNSEFRKALFNREYFPNIPEIKRVVSFPVVLQDGEIVTERGYNEPSKLYLNLEGNYPHILPTPPQAGKRLLGLFKNFPFRTESDKAGVIALILTILAKHLIAGQIPCFGVDANRPGCGKTHVVKIAMGIAEGGDISFTTTNTSDQTELRKYMLAIALAGKTYAAFDNLDGENFGGSVMENILTSGMVGDRILGLSKVVDVSFGAVVVATFNNGHYSTGMKRRVVPIFLETDNPRPAERDPNEFEHPNILQHIRNHRNELVWDALAILSGYLKAGRPDQGLPNFGSFEEWSDLIRSALVFAELPDCLENRNEIMEDNDLDLTAAQQLIIAWDFDKPATVKEIVESIKSGTKPGLRKFLDECPDGQNPSSFMGQMFKRSLGYTYGNKTLVNNKRKQRPKWYITTMEKQQ